MFTSSTEQGFILLFYPFNFNNFQYYGYMSLVGAKFMVDLKFMQIIVVYDNFPDNVSKLIKMFGLKLLKIDLNTISKTPNLVI